MTPTARSLKLLRSRGWTAQVVERWNPHARVRQDVFGFGDVLACVWWGGVLMVQTTSGSHTSERIAKIVAEPKARIWIKAGGSIVVHGWRKLKVKRGGKAVRWECDERPLTLADFGG